MITSTEISNLISAQLAAATQAQAFAQSINPAQPQSSDTLGLGTAVGAGLGRATASAIASIPTMASIAAFTGLAPQIVDPFLGVYQAGSAGFNSKGGGALRAIGTAGAALGGYMVASSFIQETSQQLMRGVQEQMAINQMLSSEATRRNMPLMSSPIAPMAPAFGGMLRGMATNMGVSTGDLTDVVGNAMAGGMFRSASSYSALSGQVADYGSSLGYLSNNLGIGVAAGADAIQQMQSLGFGGHRNAAMAAHSVYAISGGLGMQPDALIGAGQYGQHISRSMGLSGGLGARTAMGLAGRIGAATLSGGISQSAVMDLTSTGSFDEGLPILTGQLTHAAMNVAMSNPTLMAGLIDAETGQISNSLASSFSSGAISSKELEKMAKKNLKNKGVVAAMNARSGSLASQLIEQIGPEGLLGGFAQSVMTTRGVKAGENPEDVMDMLLQQYGGLGEQQANLVQELMQAGPQIRAEIQQRVGDEARSMSSSANFQKKYSLDAIKKRIVDATVGPAIGWLKNAGADIVNWGTDAIQGAVGTLFGEEDPRFGKRDAVSPLMASQYNKMLQGAPNVWGGVGGSQGDWQFRQDGFVNGQAATVGSPPVSGIAGAMMSYAPAWTVGSDNGYSAAMSGLGPGMMLGGRMAGAVGNALLDRGTDNLMYGGFTQMARGAGQSALGLIARGAARALPFVGGALMAYDVATNVVPAVTDFFGFTNDYSGAISGDAAVALEDAYKAGSLVGTVTEAPIGGMVGWGAAGMQSRYKDKTRIYGTELAVNDAEYLKEISETRKALSTPLDYLRDTGVGDDFEGDLRREYRGRKTDIDYDVRDIKSEEEKFKYMSGALPSLASKSRYQKIAGLSVLGIPLPGVEAIARGYTSNYREAGKQIKDSLGRLRKRVTTPAGEGTIIDVEKNGLLGEDATSATSLSRYVALGEEETKGIEQFLRDAMANPMARDQLAALAKNPGDYKTFTEAREALNPLLALAGNAPGVDIVNASLNNQWALPETGGNYPGIVGILGGIANDDGRVAKAALNQTLSKGLTSLNQLYGSGNRNRIEAILGGNSLITGAEGRLEEAFKFTDENDTNDASASKFIRDSMGASVMEFLDYTDKEQMAALPLFDDETRELLGNARHINMSGKTKRKTGRGLGQMLGTLPGSDFILDAKFNDSLAKSVKDGDLVAYQMRDLNRMLASMGIDGPARNNVLKESKEFAQAKGSDDARKELAAALAVAGATSKGVVKSGQQVDPNDTLNRFVSGMGELLSRIEAINGMTSQ